MATTPTRATAAVRYGNAHLPAQLASAATIWVSSLPLPGAGQVRRPDGEQAQHVIEEYHQDGEEGGCRDAHRDARRMGAVRVRRDGPAPPSEPTFPRLLTSHPRALRRFARSSTMLTADISNSAAEAVVRQVTGHISMRRPYREGLSRGAVHLPGTAPYGRHLLGRAQLPLGGEPLRFRSVRRPVPRQYRRRDRRLLDLLQPGYPRIPRQESRSLHHWKATRTSWTRSSRADSGASIRTTRTGYVPTRCTLSVRSWGWPPCPCNDSDLGDFLIGAEQARFDQAEAARWRSSRAFRYSATTRSVSSWADVSLLSLSRVIRPPWSRFTRSHTSSTWP